MKTTTTTTTALIIAGLWDLTFLSINMCAWILNIHIDGCYNNNTRKNRIGGALLYS
jgi:hypothetical protein